MTKIPLKQDILRALANLIEHARDVRFGQLIANLAVIARGPAPEAARDLEDDELLAAIQSHIQDYERHHVEVA